MVKAALVDVDEPWLGTGGVHGVDHRPARQCGDEHGVTTADLLGPEHELEDRELPDDVVTAWQR